MRRRVIGILAAVLLAVLGTAALVRFVQSARDEAVEDEAQVSVLVLTENIPQGATVDEIRGMSELTKVPKRLVAPDAISDLSSVSGDLVASVDLREGEQLLANRLVDARSLVRVAVPEGLQQITLALSPERAVGADLQPGDTVGILFSFNPFELSVSGTATESTVPGEGGAPTETTVAPTRTPNMTHLTLHKILVTAVQYSREDSERVAVVQGNETDGATDTTIRATVEEAPGDELLITLAVTAAEAEQLVFAKEFGTIWLTSEGPDASEEGTRIVTLSVVFVTEPR